MSEFYPPPLVYFNAQLSSLCHWMADVCLCQDNLFNAICQILPGFDRSLFTSSVSLIFYFQPQLSFPGHVFCCNE